MNSIPEALQDLKRRINAGKAVVITQLILVIASAVVTLGFHMWTPGIILMAVMMAMYFVVSRPMSSSYNKAVAKANIRFGICPELDDYSYDFKGNMDKAAFDEWKMLPSSDKKGGLFLRHGFSGTSKNITFTGNEATIANLVPQEGKRPARFFLSGTLLTAQGELAQDKGDWLFLREELLPEELLAPFIRDNGYIKAECPVAGFECWSQAPGNAFPADLAEKLSEFYTRNECLAAVRFCAKGAACLLHRRFYTGSGKASQRITEQQLRYNTLPETEGIWPIFKSWIRKQ